MFLTTSLLPTIDLSHQKTIEEKRNKLNEDHELLKTQVEELMKNKDCENIFFFYLFLLFVHFLQIDFLHILFKTHGSVV